MKVGFIGAIFAIGACGAADAGKILFLDGTNCYHESDFFQDQGGHVQGQYFLVKDGVRVQGPFELERFAEYGAAPGRPGIVTPVDPGNYTVEVFCGADPAYEIPVPVPGDLPNVDLIMQNNSPRVRSFRAMHNGVSVRQVLPGTTVKLKVRISDPLPSKNGFISHLYT